MFFGNSNNIVSGKMKNLLGLPGHGTVWIKFHDGITHCINVKGLMNNVSYKGASENVILVVV